MIKLGLSIFEEEKAEDDDDDMPALDDNNIDEVSLLQKILLSFSNEC